MANERLIFEVVAEGKNLKAVQLDAHKLADGIERTDSAYNKSAGSQERFHRGAKGVAGTSANTTKNFSKMRSAMGGSSGIVAAYATLAANVFAVTAAFNALQRAAAFQELARGLEFVGRSAGQHLGQVADSLKEITGAAVSTEQAMRTTAVGLSAGFNPSQLEDLTRVAKGASLALGRDLGDALDRLVRGTAKLEPEILDELGIMVRLDDATEAYAVKLGKTAGALTRFERQQAFLNATTEQGLKKFGQIAKELDPNPYDRLSAAFDNLVKSGLNIVNMFLTPLVEALAESQGMLLGVGTAFVGTISGQMLPGMMQMASNTAMMADETRKNAATQLQSLGATRQHSDAIKNLLGKIHDGTATTKEYDATVRQLNQSIVKYQRDLDGMNEADEGYAKGAARKNRLMDQQRATLTELDHAFRQQAVSQAQFSSANAIGAASQLDFRGAIDSTKDAFEKFEKGQAESVKGSKKQNKALQMLERGFFKAGLSARVFGAGLMSAIPIIGIAITAASALYAALLSLIPEDKIAKATQKSIERINEFIKANEQLERFLAQAGVEGPEKAAASLKVYSGGLQGITQDLKDQKVQLVAATKARADDAEAAMKAQKTIVDNMSSPNHNVRMLYIGKDREEEIKKLMRLEQEAAKARAKSEADVEFNQRSLLLTVQRNIEGVRVLNDEYLDTAAAVTVLEKFETTLKKTAVTQEEMNEGVKDFEDFAANILAFSGNIEGADETVQNLNKNIAGLFKKAATPFDQVLESAKQMSGALETAFKLDNTVKVLKDDMTAVQLQMQKLGANEVFGGKGAEEIITYVGELEKARDNLIKLPAETKTLVALTKKLAGAAEQSADAFTVLQEVQENIAQNRIKTLQSEILLTEFAATSSKNSIEVRVEAEKKLHELMESRIQAELELASATLQTERTNENNAKIEQKRLDLELKRVSALNQAATLSRETAKIDRQMTAMKTAGAVSDELNPRTEAEIRKKSGIAEKTRLKEEAGIKKQQIDNEYALLSAKEKIAKEELNISAKVMKNKATELAMRRGELALEHSKVKKGMEEDNASEENIEAMTQRYADLDAIILETINSTMGLGTALDAAYTAFTETDYSAVAQAQKDLVDAETARAEKGIDKEVADLSLEALNNYRDQVGIKETLAEVTAEERDLEGLKEKSLIRQNIELANSLDHKKKIAEINKQIVDLERQEFDAIEKKYLLETKLARLKDTSLTDANRTKTFAIDEINARKNAEKETGDTRSKMLIRERDAEKARLTAEITMQQMRHALILQEFGLIDAKLTAAEAIAKTEGKDTSALQAAKGKIQNQENQVRKNMSEIEAKATEVLKQRLKTMNAIIDAKEVENEFEEKSLENKRKMEAIEAASGGGTFAQRIAAFQAAGGVGGAEGDGDDLGFGDKMKVLKGFTSEMVENMKTLGPDGELVGAAIQGAFVITEAWTGVGDVFNRAADSTLGVATSGEKAAAILGAVGQTIGQINQIMAQSDQQKINATQKAIDIEKKRDGKSKESLARIQALEKKKDAQARKAFERNKKMQMAQVIISTASAAMAAWSPPPVGTGPLLGGFLSAAIVAMGAAQLAMIAGTSYDGGGAGGVGGGMPKSVNVGDRGNKVDVARSGNAGGELAYLRGERGTGTSSADFKPSFGGRYRAAGGTAYMVGEQGPELFVPETPGRIMEQEDSAPNMGGVVNANFTIQAIDATNMQETLTSQRGNIIGMIREAANASGETFLETVDTLGLQSEGAK